MLFLHLADSLESHVLYHVLDSFEFLFLDTLAWSRGQHPEVEIVHILDVTHFSLHPVLHFKLHLQLDRLLHTQTIFILKPNASDA